MATRKAHSHRLARMKALQTEYKLVVEQLKTYETEKYIKQINPPLWLVTFVCSDHPKRSHKTLDDQ